MRFKSKTVAVTGAAVGIGRVAAVRFAAEGARVFALDVNASGLEDLRKEIEAGGGVVLTAVCNVADAEAVSAAFKLAEEKLGSIDVLVNNAALWRDSIPFTEAPVELWKKYLDINIMGVVYCTKAVLPSMLSAGFGRIINIASVAGVYGNANMVHYSATKGALISMTRALAKEVADKGVTVNAVSPGSVSPSEEQGYDYVQPSPLNYMGRTGSGNENADLICFLASDAASYISGQNIQIDGCRRKI